jgi:glycosyltransferase involved in cell wall biosynthesis
VCARSGGNVAKMNSMFENHKQAGPGLVSVIIPCYNHARFLGEAIESVLGQTWREFEIIVVDDGSTDNTAEVASRYPFLQYVHQQNQGLSASRNTGLRRSNGRFLVFLDADDRLRPAALETGVRLLTMHPECAISVGRCQHIGHDGTLLDDYSPAAGQWSEHYSALLQQRFIQNPASVMYRRQVFDAVGPFDPSVNAAADYDLYLRIAQAHSILCYDDVIVEYRRYSTSMSSNTALMFKTLMVVLDSQKRHVKAHPEYKEVYKTSMQVLRRYMGEQLAEEMISQIRNRPFSRRLLRDLRVLLRWYPAGIAVIGGRVSRKTGSDLYRKLFPRRTGVS